MKHVNITKNDALKERVENNGQEKKKSRAKWPAVLFMMVLLVAVSFLMFGNDVKAIFDPVSIVETVSSTTDLKEEDGRTNVLILGSDARNFDGEEAIRTDTILIASIGRLQNDILMISLPRDLWVKSPSGYYSKINAVYNNGGGEETKTVVSEVTGIPIHYYALVDFKLFQDTIDTLGGIEVNVDNSFTDYYYPVAGKEAAPFNERYQTVEFTEGVQTMDGETALKYVRSRKGNNNEDTDFARSARQQKVIMAIKDKALTVETIMNPVKIKELYETYENNVDTDVSLTEVQSFYVLSQQMDVNNVRSVVLDDRSLAEEGGILYSPEDTSLYGGAYVLLPKSGDYSQIRAYMQRYMFGEE